MCPQNSLGVDHLIRGEGDYAFSCDQTFFFYCQLKVQYFLNPISKVNNFFSHWSNTKLFHHLFHLILRTRQVLEMSHHIPGLSTVMFL